LSVARNLGPSGATGADRCLIGDLPKIGDLCLSICEVFCFAVALETGHGGLDRRSTGAVEYRERGC
jgi:hypothetical protein